MGYFDALAASSFKEEKGRWVFYPWGALGRGYVIPTETQYVEIYTWVKRNLQIWLPLVIVIGIAAGWIWSILLLPIFGVWYVARLRGITNGLEAAAERMTLGDSYRAQANHYSMPGLWALEISSLAFVIVGIVILAVEPQAWLVAVTSIGFFGACATAIGVMIAARISSAPTTRFQSEGMRRLSILCGVIAAAAWIIFVLVASNGFSGMQPEEWIVVVVGIAVCYASALYLVRGVDWVIQGFKNDG